MFIRGEKINYLNIEETVRNIFGNSMHEKRQQSLASAVLGVILIRWYAKRWGIEPQFRDTKDLHFGMGLSKTSISEPQRRDRLLLVSALAVMMLTLLDAVGEKLGMDRYLKANTVKHRTMSLFRHGVHYYNQMIDMTNSELKVFFDYFLELLNDHKNLQDILRVI